MPSITGLGNIQKNKDDLGLAVSFLALKGPHLPKFGDLLEKLTRLHRDLYSGLRFIIAKDVE